VTPQRFKCWAVILGLFISSVGQAADADFPETYIALYGGLTVPKSFTDNRVLSVDLTNLELARSAIFGAKLGMFLPGRDRWSGLETEFFYTNPHIKQQDITFSGGGVPPTTANFAGAHVRVATWAVNWIIRYPGEWFLPYIGAGPGIFWGRVSGAHTGLTPPDIGTGSDTSLGLNALAGARFFLSKRMALFGEYKYNRVTFDFGGTASLHTLYEPQHFVGGFSLLF